MWFDLIFLESIGSFINSKVPLSLAAKGPFFSQPGSAWSRLFLSVCADEFADSRPLCDALPGFGATADCDGNAVDLKLPPCKRKKKTTREEESSKQALRPRLRRLRAGNRPNLDSLGGEIASRLEASVALSKWWLNTNRNQSEPHSSSKTSDFQRLASAPDAWEA